MKPAEGTPILDASVAAEGPATDPCTGRALRFNARGHILVWLSEGAREVTWALCSLPRERWVELPPAQVDAWPALRHVRHLALHEAHQTLPLVRQALGEAPEADSPPLSTLELEHADAAWDAQSAAEMADTLVQSLGETRFELLRRLETAPDNDELDWLMLSARQHELQHAAALWRIALNWDRATRAAVPGVPLHPADRLEESH